MSLLIVQRSKMTFYLREKEEEYHAINQQLQMKTEKLLQEANQVIVCNKYNNSLKFVCNNLILIVCY